MTVTLKKTELGALPVNWTVYKLEELADKHENYSFTGGPFGSDLKKSDYTDEGVRIIQLQNIGEGYFANDYKIYTSEKKAKQLSSCTIYPNDIIIAKMADPVARACIIPSYESKYLMASDGIRLVVDKERFDTKFVMYAINSEYFRRNAEAQSTGTTRLRIGLSALRALPVAVPSLFEQKKIANILTTIDEQIELTLKFIEKTKELKRGLEQNLLRKGLGNQNFKESEIGDIPTDWNLVVLENVLKEKNGYRRGPFGGALKKEIFVESGYPVYEQQHAIHNGNKEFRYFVTEEKFNEMKNFAVKDGDFLISCSGTVGKVIRIDESFPKGIINQALLRLRFNEEILNSDFGLHLLKSEYMFKQMTGKTHGTTLKNIVGASEFKKIPFALPPIKEQIKIASILSSIDEQINIHIESMVNYKNLKKGLMQKLLTGKIRVR